MGGDLWGTAQTALDPGGVVFGNGIFQEADYNTPAASEGEKLLAQIAQSLYSETAPARDFWTGLFQDVQQGTYDPTRAPGYNPARRAVEAQYGTAKEQLLSNGATGGALTSALGNLEASRANAVGDLASNALADLLAKSYGAGFNAPGAAMTGLGTSAGLMNQRTIAELQAESNADKGLSQLSLTGRSK